MERDASAQVSAGAPAPNGSVRRRLLPEALQGKPFRRLQREVNQRRFRWANRNIMVIGQPKSGTNWVTRMLTDVPGYQRWTPRNISLTCHDVRRCDFIPPAAGYTVTKLHTEATEENAAVVREAGRPVVIVQRDPRDLAVSWAYYVGLPGRDRVANPDALPMDIPERISLYIDRVLPRIIGWPIRWRERLPDELRIEVRYESLKADDAGVMIGVFERLALLGLHGVDESFVRGICNRRSFSKETGRKPGEADAGQFNRKGIVGDWRNHFSDEQVEAFKRVAGAALIEQGYETDLDW